jgi:hypothetical protein
MRWAEQWAAIGDDVVIGVATTAARGEDHDHCGERPQHSFTIDRDPPLESK